MVRNLLRRKPFTSLSEIYRRYSRDERSPYKSPMIERDPESIPDSAMFITGSLGLDDKGSGENYLGHARIPEKMARNSSFGLMDAEGTPYRTIELHHIPSPVGETDKLGQKLKVVFKT